MDFCKDTFNIFQVGEKGKVVGIDHIDELVNWAKDNVRKDNAPLLDSGRIKLVVGDGRKGFPADAPYNAIHVGAAAPTLPQEVYLEININQTRCLFLTLKDEISKMYILISLVGRSVSAWRKNHYTSRPRGRRSIFRTDRQSSPWKGYKNKTNGSEICSPH